MQKLEKILQYFKNIKFKKINAKKKVKIVANLNKKYYDKNKIKFNLCYFFLNKKIYCNNLFIFNYKNIFKFFIILNLNKKIKKKSFFLKVKQHTNLLLINVFLQKKKIMKPTVKEVKNALNKSLSIKFILYFIKKILFNKNKFYYVFFFMIKKIKKEKPMYNFKSFYIYVNIFKLIKFVILMFKIIFNLKIKIKPVYNTSHSLNNLKQKKIRRI